jgi:hypothetical protein
MNLRTSLLRAVLGLSVLVVVANQVAAQGGPPWAGRGGGQGRGPGWGVSAAGRGGGPAWARQTGVGDLQFAADRDVFHYLLQNHDQIRRDVKNTKNGVETLTESDKPEIAAKIQEHVAAMAKRVEERRPIHMRDPLFAEVFRHADKIQLKYTKTAKGVRVVETSDDPYVVELIQAHGGVVSLFVKNGFNEAWQNHEVPGAQGGAAAAAPGPIAGAVGCPRAGCPLAAAGQCPRAAAGLCPAGKNCPLAAAGQCPRAAAGLCPAGKNCPLAAAGQCPRAAAGPCPAGKNCPLAKPCPAGKDCPYAKSCPAGKDCPMAQQCPAGKACPGCPGAGICPLSGANEPPPLPKASEKPESK